MTKWMSMQHLIFFVGAFITAIGTHTFVSSGLAFMQIAGLTMAQIGAVMMISRFANLIANFFLGDLVDYIPAQWLIIFGEITNIFVTIGLILIWPSVTDNFYAFTILVFLRSLLIAVSAPSQQKLVRIIFDGDSEKLKRAAVTLNVVNYGSVLISNIISWYAIKNQGFQFILILDGITFLFNGFLVWFSLRKIISSNHNHEKFHFKNPFSKFKIYFQNCRSVVIADVILNFCVFGTNILMLRLAGKHVEWVPILLVTFGLAVWLSSWLLKHFDPTYLNKISWYLLPVAFLLMMAGQGSLVITVCAVFFRNVLYWNIFNVHSQLVQVSSPVNKIGAISSARNALATLILGSGELIAGSLVINISLETELAIRAMLALVFAIFVVQFLKRSA